MEVSNQKNSLLIPLQVLYAYLNTQTHYVVSFLDTIPPKTTKDPLSSPYFVLLCKQPALASH